MLVRYAYQVTHDSGKSPSHAFANQVIKKSDGMRFLPPVLRRIGTNHSIIGVLILKVDTLFSRLIFQLRALIVKAN